MVRLDQNGWTTIADLALSESMKPQSMGAILTALEERLVKRRPHPTDGRQVRFALIEAGREALRQRSLAKREWLVAGIRKLYSSEQRRLIDAIPLIQRLSDFLSSPPAPGPASETSAMKNSTSRRACAPLAGRPRRSVLLSRWRGALA